MLSSFVSIVKNLEAVIKLSREMSEVKGKKRRQDNKN